MKNSSEYSLEDIKSLGKEKSEENIDTLLFLYGQDLDVSLKREVVSSIGRQTNLDRVYAFIAENAFQDATIMEYIYQMFRTCLYRSRQDIRFDNLRKQMLEFYHNEVLNKMQEFYDFKKTSRRKEGAEKIERPILLCGDSEDTLNQLPENSIQLAFTSPPYYNARAYSDYHSYQDYLKKMGKVFKACHRVIEEGRFLIVNVSPVITKRPGREFESIRYPIHFDFHRILEEAGFYFIDEIIWVKPEPSAKNRIGGYEQTRKPLSYKPNCVTESVMVYRKKCSFLLDENIKGYGEYEGLSEGEIDRTNCWYIAPRSDKAHPAVFPEELCRRILKYYSFEGDAVLDPFAGSGTFGKVAHEMNRVPVMGEIEKSYIKRMMEDKINYDVRT